VTLAWTLAACQSAPSGGTQICEHYDDDPIPPGYDENGCWAPTEYFERGPEVIPDAGANAPVLRLEASGEFPGGMEGQIFFARVMSPTSRIVLERDWDWPGFEQEIPPGAYQVTAWARYCDGNCDLLDPPMLSCTVDVLAEPSMTYTLSYETALDGGVDCAIRLAEG